MHNYLKNNHMQKFYLNPISNAEHKAIFENGPPSKNNNDISLNCVYK